MLPPKQKPQLKPTTPMNGSPRPGPMTQQTQHNQRPPLVPKKPMTGKPILSNRPLKRLELP